MNRLNWLEIILQEILIRIKWRFTQNARSVEGTFIFSTFTILVPCDRIRWGHQLILIFGIGVEKQKVAFCYNPSTEIWINSSPHLIPSYVAHIANVETIKSSFSTSLPLVFQVNLCIATNQKYKKRHSGIHMKNIRWHILMKFYGYCSHCKTGRRRNKYILNILEKLTIYHMNINGWKPKNIIPIFPDLSFSNLHKLQ